MKNFITKILLLPILVFALAFSVLVVPRSLAKAYASGEDEEKIIYYFSDDEHCTTYRYLLSLEYGFTVHELYDWSDRGEYDDFEDAYNDNVNSIGWDEMINAYIIFEMNTGFRGNADMQPGDVSFPEILEDLFYTLKTQGCHIMFICGTEENRFENYNGFLDYVDIHINTDLYDLFMIGTFMKVLDSTSAPLENVTFIIDESFGGLDMIDNNEFFTEWLMLYLYYAYPNDVYMLGATWKGICDYHGIKIILCRQDGSYRDIFYPQIILYDSAYDTDHEEIGDFINYIDNAYICAVGTSNQGSMALYDFISDINDLAEAMQRTDISLFVHNPASYELPTYNRGTIYQARTYTNYCNIIADFLRDADLNTYDNWDGRCVITHKAISFGEDGWMTPPYGSFSCWYKYRPTPDPEIPYVQQ